ncbi:MAG: glycosyltransferase family 2 protein [bacterium]|nr:glycosyltransferase family 2 protein [bacterium]
MDISVIIVSWKVKEKLRANLLALQPALSALESEVFVVDNNSGDGSAEMVKTEFRDVHLIANDKNIGFAAANNQAIKRATGDFILLLNPDMRVFPETISRMIVWAGAHPQAVVSGCKLVTEVGELLPHVRRFPRLSDQLAVVLKLPHLFPRILNVYLQKDFNYENEAKVDSIRGAFFLINRQSWKNISGEEKPYLDERYFIWFEEVDFCRQVYKNGGEVWYTPAAVCVDYVGQSFNQVGVNFKQQYFQNSMLAYFRKWEPGTQAHILHAVWPLGRMLAKIFS